jgi:iduronate 2-sulfatase
MMRSLQRREFIKLAGTATAAGLLGRMPHLSGSPPDRFNVLYISVDDLRPELGCMGIGLIKTPSIDRLAQRGLIFSRAYCQMAMCNPGRSSLLTGMRPDTIRVWDQETHFRRTFANIVTFPQLFKNNGYRTIAAGKIFHNSLPDPPSWSQTETLIPPTYTYMSSETRTRQRRRRAAARAIGRSDGWIDAYLRGPATECYEAPDNAYEDGAIADAAISLLADLQKFEEPFFLGVGFINPHLPFVAPKKYWDLYKREDIPLAPDNFLPKNAPRFAINNLTELACHEDFVQVPNPTEGRLADEQARLLKHGYWACVSFVDAQIGRLLETLDQLGLRDKTIVVLCGDSGYKLGEHGSWGKLTNYEIDVRTPLIISAPGQEHPGATTGALVEFVDVFPTIAQLAGLAAPPNLEGISLAPLFSDPRRPWKSAAFHQFPRGFTNRFMGRGIRTDQYHYIEWRDWYDDDLVAAELYDHASDPGEDTNVAGQAAYRDVLRQVEAQLKAGWRAALPRS